MKNKKENFDYNEKMYTKYICYCIRNKWSKPSNVAMNGSVQNKKENGLSINILSVFIHVFMYLCFHVVFTVPG